MIRRVQRFLSNNLNDQYVPRPAEKEFKESMSYQDRALRMKMKFGKDYESPYDKYDIHLPRCDVGSPSMEERLHKKNDYKIMRDFGKFLIVFSLFIYGVFFSDLKSSQKEAEEDKKELLKRIVVKQKVLEKFSEIYEERKNSSKKD